MEEIKYRKIIECCYQCVAPKRHPGCHDRCPEYLKERKERDAFLEAERKRKEISNGITIQRTAGVTKALRKRRYNKDGK